MSGVIPWAGAIEEAVKWINFWHRREIIEARPWQPPRSRKRHVLGERDFAIVYAVVVDDLSWPELERRMRVAATTAKRQAVKAIARLGER